MSRDETNAADDGSNTTADESSVDAFALVGNEIRAAIVRALGDPAVRGGPPLSFSELRSRVDVDVRSSQFNYHLKRLVGHFVDRTDDGYRLRPEGRALHRSLLAGTFDRRTADSSIDAGFDCHYCSMPVEAIVDEGTLRIRCPDCAYRYDVATIPPGVELASDDALDRIARYTHHDHLAFARGVCPTCGTPPTVELRRPEETPFETDSRRAVSVSASCSNCGNRRFLSVGEALLGDADLRSFCLDHGVDVLGTPLWELAFAATDRTVTVRSTDPWRVGLVVAFEEGTLELVVDGDLDVVERTHEPTDGR